MKVSPPQHKCQAGFFATNRSAPGIASTSFSGLTFRMLTWGMTSVLSLYAVQGIAETLDITDKQRMHTTEPLDTSRRNESSTIDENTVTPDTLSTVDVVSTALSDTTEGTGLWTTGTTTSSIRLPMSVRETPQSVSVITDQRIKDRNMTSLEDVMRDVTGVNVMTDTGGRYHFESRGFAIQNVQQDGVNSLPGSPSGNVYRSAIDMPDLAIYDHVEVLRGVSGLLQGNGTPGGSVNLVRKRPTEKFQASTSMTVGSNALRRNEADISGPIGLQGRLRGRAVIVNEDRGTDKPEVDRDLTGFFGTFEYDLDDHTHVDAGFYRQRSHKVPDIYGIPLDNNGQDLGLSRSTFLGADWNTAQYDRLDLFTSITHDFDNEWTAKGTLNFTRSRSDSKGANAFGAVDTSTGTREDTVFTYDSATQYHNTADQMSFNVNATGPFHFLGHQHELVLGADIKSDSSNNLSKLKRVTDTTGPNAWRSDATTIIEPTWSSLSPAFDAHYLQRQQALYAVGRFSLTDDVKFIVGGRFTEYDIYTHYLDDNTSKRNRWHGVTTPYTGLTWNFMPSWTAYASYTSIFQPQTDTDRNGKMLDPIEGNGYETGIKASLFDGALDGSIALFRIDQKNRAITVANSSECLTSTSCSEASGLIRSQGVELELTGSPVNNLMLGGGYTYNDLRYEKSEGRYFKGDRANSYTPRNILRLYSQYQLPGEWSKWGVGAGISTQSDTLSAKPYNIKQGGYTLFNASISYRYNDHFDVALIGNNLTDKRYYEAYNNRSKYANNFYGESRNIALRATLKY